MTVTNRIRRAAGLALAAGALLIAPAAAQANDSSYQNTEQRVFGRVISFEPWHLLLDHGPRMVLHRGTVIHPTGLSLRNGMSVRVIGHVTNDGAFSADQIDLMPPESAWDRFRR